MTKFLREYNRIILVVFGVMLMVAFLLPDALKHLGQDQSNKTFIRIDGTKVTNAQADIALREQKALAALVGPLMNQIGIEKNVEHWLLLTHEAEGAGLVGGAGDGHAYLDVLAREMFKLSNPYTWPQKLETKAGQDELANMLSAYERGRFAASTQMRLTEDQFDRAVAKLHGIVRLRGAYFGGVENVSDRRTIVEGKRSQDEAIVDAVFIPAALTAQTGPEPDAPALAAHFDRFKGVKQGAGDFGIGYILPPRVRVEWMKIDRKAVEAAFKIDQIELAKRVIAQNPAGGEWNSSAQQDTRQKIFDQIKKSTIDRAMLEADNTVRGEISKATRGLATRGEYKVLPPEAEWARQRPDFEKIRDAVVQRVKDATGLTIPAPAVTARRDAWLTAEDLSTLEGIGRSALPRGNQQVPFAAVATTVQEIDPKSRLGLQVGLPGDPTVDQEGSHYFYTVLAARGESAPDSMEEIRERVVMDAKTLAAFEEMQKNLDATRARAAAQGLAPIAAEVDSRRSAAEQAAGGALRADMRISRSPRAFIPGEFNTDAFKKAVLDAAAGIDPTVKADTVDAAARTVAVAEPARLGVAVAQVKGVTPLTAEVYRLQEPLITRTMARDAFSGVVEDPFSYKNLLKRLKVELSNPAKTDEEGSEADAGSTPRG